MLPFATVLRMTCSGGSAVSDSSLPRSVGPHNTLPKKDKMETAWKLSEISCHHKCAGGVCLRYILLLQEDLLATTALCSITDLQRTNLLLWSGSWCRMAGSKTAYSASRGWIISRSKGSSFQMQWRNPPAFYQTKINHCFENSQLEVSGTQRWPCIKKREVLWKHI